jgi:hypothetical protein
LPGRGWCYSAQQRPFEWRIGQSSGMMSPPGNGLPSG